MATPNSTLFNEGLFGGPGAAGSAGAFTVSRLIYTGYRLAGVLPTAGRGYSASQLSDGLDALNSLVDADKAQGLMVYAILRTLFDLVANQTSYTIGETDADWTLERPERIEGAGFVFNNVTPNIECPMEIMSVQSWRALSSKELTSTIADRLYYEPFVPNGTIHLFPVPTIAYQIALYTWQTVNQFQTDTESVVVPPAYRRYLEHWLAIELAKRNPLTAKLSQLTIDDAKEAKRVVKAINMRQPMAHCETAALGGDSGGRYNILANRRV